MFSTILYQWKLNELSQSLLLEKSMNFCNLPRGLYIPTPDDRVSRNKLDYSVLAGTFDSGGGNAAYMWVRCV